jgi:TrmH family RNA methyltransferase
MPPRLITQVRNLQRRGARRRSREAMAEGVRLVEEAVDAGVPIVGALVTARLAESPRGATLLERLASHAVPVEEIGERELKTVADTDTPQGIVALIEPPRSGLDSVVPRPGSAVLVLDGVQDPGNVGTLLRTAFALGSPGAVLLPGCADAAHPKVMRAGMGATFRFPVAAASLDTFEAWSSGGAVEVWAAGGEGTPLSRVTPPERLAIVVGNEGAGVSNAVRRLARRQVAIPLARGAESLNVAVAAGILLHEVGHAG